MLTPHSSHVSKEDVPTISVVMLSNQPNPPSMKKILSLSKALLLLLLVQSCESDESLCCNGGGGTQYPLHMEVLDMTYDLTYNPSYTRVEKLKSTQHLQSGVKLESEHIFFYNAQGKLTESGANTQWKYVYTYEGDVIIRTDEFIDDVYTQHSTFSYDDKKRLAERITWQDIPEEGGLIPVSKETYVYNAENNVSESHLFYFDSGSDTHKLLTSFFYSGYDDKLNSEEAFFPNVYNPIAKFRINNPGKLIVKNANGVVSITNTYTYTYDGDYTWIKQTHSVPGNGSVNDYQTRYYLGPNPL